MFYVNNKQVLGMFLNGKNYSYLAYGFGKLIPENRNVQFAYINLADRNLSQYRVEFGTVKDGYENALVSPRFDKPDSNGIFHTPFTYYYGGNIVPTKKVPVLITNGRHALSNALVYNDMNINGAINYFAENTDFQGHNVNVLKEAESFQVYQALLNYGMLNNCSNFDLNIETRFSKAAYPTLYNCNSFSGNFRYVGNQDNKYPGFRGFLHTCRDGSFNFNLMNMRGGGNDTNVTNYYNFSCISNCNNIRLNINGSPWQAWVHPNCYSSNCNITARNIVPGFDRMNHCNFNIYLPSNANVEKSTDYSILSNSYNCNVYFDGTNTNISSFRNRDSTLALFENLNNCNLNLVLSNSTGIDYMVGNLLYNCNIQFYNGNNFTFGKVGESKFTLKNVNNVNINGAYNTNFNLYNATGNAILRNLNNVDFVERGTAFYTITNIDNCYNSWIYADTLNGTIENVYNTRLVLMNSYANFRMCRVDKCEITGFPTTAAYTTNCRFDVGLEGAIARNSRYVTWANVWSHGFRVSSGQYGYLAGLRSVDGFISGCSIASDDMTLGGSRTLISFDSVETDISTYYNGIVTANLKNYTMSIKLNVDCNTLNLGVFMEGPPHGFEYSSISADNIFCTTGKNYYVLMNYGTRLYCENYCNVPFTLIWCRFSDNYQPVLLINNYQHSNADACSFSGGITRIGRLNYQGGGQAPLALENGACVFINNTVISNTKVDNSLLFLGTNVRVGGGGITVTNGGLVVNKANYSMDAIGKFVNRKNFVWNFTDSGPWGSQSLLNFCLNV